MEKLNAAFYAHLIRVLKAAEMFVSVEQASGKIKRTAYERLKEAVDEDGYV